MLYLVDSSAKNSLGHNLEYLERIASNSKLEFILIGNRDLEVNGDSRYCPTFEFGTWDFGRFGLGKRKSNGEKGQTRQTLRASNVLLVTEKLVETVAKFVAGFIGRPTLFMAGLTQQSKCYYRDISFGLAEIHNDSKVIISTANSRELVGLSKWIRDSLPNTYCISVILRRPIVDLRSFLELPLIFIDALISISILKELATHVRFLADTPGLAARISERGGERIEEIPALGFEPQQLKANPKLDVAIAPNSRPETRYSDEALSAIPDLRNPKNINLNSNSYRELLSTTRSMVMPYDPLRYRSRSSGIFAEVLTLGILPIVPTGTSMSREITKLNLGNMSSPDLITELKIGDALYLSQFAEGSFLVSLEANFCGSIVLEISDHAGGIKASIHDFFEIGAMDSFLIQPTKLNKISFKSGGVVLENDIKLKITVSKIPDKLYGVAYLDGQLLQVLTRTREISFAAVDESEIINHSPVSLCSLLGI